MGRTFRTEMIELDRLNKAEWNYKTDDEAMGKKLAENIKRNGILQASIVYEEEDGRLVVIDGNHRLDAYREIKTELVPCVMLGQIPLSAAKRLAIEINETKFDADPLKLAETVKDIALDFGMDDLQITLPFSDDELENFSALLDFDWDEVEAQTETEPIEFDAKKNVVTCPNCEHRFEVKNAKSKE